MILLKQPGMTAGFKPGKDLPAKLWSRTSGKHVPWAPLPCTSTHSQGGYHLPSLGEAVAESFRGLLGAPPASPPPAQLTAGRLLSEEPLAKVEAAVAEARRRHGLG